MLAVATELAMSQRTSHAEAFEEAYDAHWERVFHLCLRYGAGNASWAEDVTHDVFVKLLEHLPRLADPGDLGGWLYRVATNQALSRLRREKSFLSWWRRAQHEPVREADPAPDRLFEGREAAAAALEAIESLPPRQRVVMCMKLLDGKSQQEIARTLSMSKGYVSKLVARATEQMRAAGWEVEDG